MIYYITFQEFFLAHISVQTPLIISSLLKIYFLLKNLIALGGGDFSSTFSHRFSDFRETKSETEG